MERHIQADNAFIKWMEAMSKNVVHIADAWYAAVKWADSHPRWISVDDELPPKENTFPDLSIDVLATNGNYICKSCYDYSVEGWLDDDFLRLDNITHWMALPQPPSKLSNLERIGKNCKEKKGGEQ